MYDTPSMLVLTMYLTCALSSLSAIRQSWLWMYDAPSMLVIMHMKYPSMLSGSPGCGCMTPLLCWHSSWLIKTE